MTKKSVKTIVSDSTKKPREKTEADKVYNARRKAKRALERLQRMAGPTSKTTRDYVQQLEETIKASYATKEKGKKPEYKFDTQRMRTSLTTASAFITEALEQEMKPSEYRKRRLFERDVQQAGAGGVSTKTREEVKIFYAATREMWEGNAREFRNAAILGNLGVETLEEAWDIVFSDENVQKALERARQNQTQAVTDADVSDGSIEPADEVGSPDYIKNLILSVA